MDWSLVDNALLYHNLHCLHQCQQDAQFLPFDFRLSVTEPNAVLYMEPIVHGSTMIPTLLYSRVNTHIHTYILSSPFSGTIATCRVC